MLVFLISKYQFAVQVLQEKNYETPTSKRARNMSFIRHVYVHPEITKELNLAVAFLPQETKPSFFSRGKNHKTNFSRVISFFSPSSFP